MNIIFLGAQGSGKGTQAEKLEHALGLHHISSGDLFRKAFEEKTSLGLQAKVYVDRGELVPDRITVAMVLEQIERLNYLQGILLDGFPRTIIQAEALDRGLRQSRQHIDKAIYLEVPRDKLLTRLSGRYICRVNQHVYHSTTHQPQIAGICDLDGSELYQRSDDKGEAVQKRLDTFFHETIQLLDYYKRQQKLLTINGNQDIDKVHLDLLYALNAEANQESTLEILPWQIPVQPNTSLPRL